MNQTKVGVGKCGDVSSNCRSVNERADIFVDSTDTNEFNSDTETLLKKPVASDMDGWRDVNQPRYGAIQSVRSTHSISAEFERTEDVEDKLALLQAQVFLEDAVKYRSVDHKVDFRSLILYRFYHSLPVSLLRYFVITLLHILAFFEFPSSLSWSSDIQFRGQRLHFPCGVTEAIEIICLILLIADAYIKSRIYGYRHLRSNKWLVVEIVCLFISVVDWTVTIAIGCREVVRVRRMLRPIFIIQNSSLMKKILNSLRKTLTQILGVLLLMGLHLFIFTLFAMLLFPKQKNQIPNTNQGSDDFLPPPISNSSKNGTDSGPSESVYFKTLIDSFMNLLVLLTTANNPDVTLPAYRDNRLAALFFIVFLIIGLYCFMNMLTAIIYNQFRGYFLSSMQSSLMRRRLGQRAVYESLKRKKNLVMNASMLEEETREGEVPGEVSVRDLKFVVSKAVMPRDMRVLVMQVVAENFTQDQMISWDKFLLVMMTVEKQFVKEQKPSIRWFYHYPKVVMFQKLICHRYFSYLGNMVALVNVVLIAIEVGDESNRAVLRIVNFIFIVYYIVEQILLLVCMGWRRFRYHTSHLLDLFIVLLLCLSEVVTVSLYGFPFFSDTSDESDLDLWNMVRVINILIMIRLLRIIWHIKAMAIVAHTLVDLVKNLRSFGGIIVVIYYSFAILGMELFQDKIKYNNITDNPTLLRYNTCGTYEQLDYWANNFDDFAAAIVVLWDVMVVNNWFVFLDVYAHYTTRVSYIYFIAWWLISVVLALNLFTALILENFIMKWDRYYEQISETQAPRSRSNSFTNSFNLNTLTVHDIFRPSLKEPNEDEILSELKKLKYFNARPV